MARKEYAAGPITVSDHPGPCIDAAASVSRACRRCSIPRPAP